MKILGLITNVEEYHKIYNHVWRKSQESKLYIDEKRHYSVEEIHQKEFASNKHKKLIVLNYIEHFLVLISTFTWCILISAIASLVAITIGITSYSMRSKICKITVEIKEYKSIIKKKKKSMTKFYY